MQREEFIQQLWLDYIHSHPDIGALRLWPLDTAAEYLTLVTLNHEPFAARTLNETLARMGYRLAGHYAMADQGVLIHLLAPEDSGSWLIVVELQLGTLSKSPRKALTELVAQNHRTHSQGHRLLCHGRPWPMPSWALYQALHAAHPLAAWLAIMGPRLHHVGFDCDTLGQSLEALDSQLLAAGMPCNDNQQNGVFPVSSTLHHRFYPSMAQKVIFAGGDEHRLCLGGLALTKKQLGHDRERIAELLLPLHTRCEVT